MKILALEFSSGQRSVAALNANADDPVLGAGEVVDSSHGNTTKPFAMIEEALRAAGFEREQVECIAVGIGPGSYTGIRAAIAVAQGWELARNVKLLGISTAECLARQAATFGKDFSIVSDAQRGEFYLSGYEVADGNAREKFPLRLATLAEVKSREAAGDLLIGPEVTRWFARGRVLFPSARVLAELALGRSDFAAGRALEPIYLREASFVKAPPARNV